jgi:hypothetical protein
MIFVDGVLHFFSIILFKFTQYQCILSLKQLAIYELLKHFCSHISKTLKLAFLGQRSRSRRCKDGRNGGLTCKGETLFPTFLL